MPIQFSYRDYVADDAFMREYGEYQKRFAETIRENDKILIDLVRRIAAPEIAAGRRPRVLDIGCSAANLLRHLNRLVPGLALTGGDLAESILADCRRDPGLEGIRFERMDLLDLAGHGPFDVVIANAVLFLFDDAEFDRALRSLGSVLAPGGHVVVFDFFHAFDDQSIAVFEKSRWHPDGMVLHFRPIARVRESLERVGFADAAFTPFAIPIDLPRPDDPGDLRTYTVPTADGARLLFRGALCQPWCFLVARRAA